MARSTAKNKNQTAAATEFPSLLKPLKFILLIGGAIGLICAFIISYDKFQLLQNPQFRPNCDLNPIISCGSVMSSMQGSAFGFPNPWIGLAAFAVLITAGVSVLAGARYKRWFWQGLLVGSFLGTVFVHWLFFQSVYRIQALCPYCMGVWIITITTFWYTLLYNLELGYFKLGGLAPAGRFIRKHHLDILVLWLLIIAALIFKHFWYYFGKFV